MADERRSDSFFHMSELTLSKQPPPAHQLTHHLATTPPPAHLGHTPPPPHIQVHSASSGPLHTPPPAHMHLPDHRSSPGLQLLGHVAASPQLRIHGTPSPHLSLHSAGSPAHGGLLTIDRPSSRESFSMTPPRAQVFPHAGVPPELMKVLRPGLPLSNNNLTIPNGPFLGTTLAPSLPPPLLQSSGYGQSDTQTSLANHLQQLNALQMMQQQQQAATVAAVQQHHAAMAAHAQQEAVREANELAFQQMLAVSSSAHMPPQSLYNHVTAQSSTANHDLGPVFQKYHRVNSSIPVPEPSPHQELKMLANIASSELGILNKTEAQDGATRVKAEPHRPPDFNKAALARSYSQRIHNLNNFPSSTPYASSYRSRSIAMQRARATCITSSAKSLDILRQVIQNTINDEVHAIIDQYVNTYFRPALENIKDNNGQTSVSEEHIQCICRKILEEASRMYMGSNGVRSRSMTPDLGDTFSEAGSVSSDKKGPKLPFSRLKRKTGAASDTDSDAGSYMKRNKRGKPSGTSGLAKNEPVKREGPRWDPDRLKPDSLFIMGSKANKVLGLAATRGRIYLKHPDIFKYSGDQDDKQWLFENNKMPGSGGKAYMMIVGDIEYLARSDEYKDSALEMNHLKGFTIPEWMLTKVKTQMRALRTDSAPVKPKFKGLVNVVQQETFDADSDADKNVPFTSAASSRKSLSDCKLGPGSPANTEEMELLSSEEQEDPPVSPFGSAEDYAPVSPGNSGGSLKPASPTGLVIGFGSLA